MRGLPTGGGSYCRPHGMHGLRARILSRCGLGHRVCAVPQRHCLGRGGACLLGMQPWLAEGGELLHYLRGWIVSEPLGAVERPLCKIMIAAQLLQRSQRR